MNNSEKIINKNKLISDGINSSESTESDENIYLKKLINEHELILSNIPTAIFKIDKISGKILDFSPYVKKMYGYPNDEILNLTISDITSDKKINHQMQIEYKDSKLAYHVKNDGFIIPVEIKEIDLEPITSEKSKLIISHDLSPKINYHDTFANNINIFKIIVENAFDAIYLLRDKHYEYVNASFCKLTGYSFDEVTSTDFDYNAFLPEESKQFMHDRYESRKKGEPIPDRYEFKIINKSGKLVDIEVSTVSIGNAQEVLVLGIMRDITDRKKYENKLKKTQAQMTAILDSLPFIAWLKDTYGRYEAVNKTFIDYTKLTFSDIINKNDFELFSNEVATKYVSEDNQVIQSGEILQSEEEVKENNELKWYETFKKPIYDEYGNIIGTSGFYRDITDWKLNENKMQKLIDDLTASKVILEDKAYEIQQLNIELLDTAEKLRISNANKDRFFSIIAHDIKSPLSGIMGLTQILSEEIGKNPDINEIKEYIMSILTSTNNLYKLIENLLQWARLQQGLITFTPNFYNINNVVDDVIQLSLGTAKQKDIAILKNIDKTNIVYFDPNMIHTVLRNLLNNSIKFSNPKSSVIISITGSNSDEFIISIEDDGIGIIDEIKDKLFKLEEHVSNPGTAKEKGSGLGLIICKEFIEKHSGKLWFEDKPKGGTIFSFSIPGKMK